jgi:hypothetical protein
VFDAAHRAALEGKKPFVYACPPAAWAVVPLFERLSPGEPRQLQTVLVVPETAIGLELAPALANLPAATPLHVATGLARTATRLISVPPRSLIAAPREVLDLAGRSALKLAEAPRLVVAWPELSLATGSAALLDTVLAEAGQAQRIVLTQDDTAITGFLERHAHRAPILFAARLPEAPAGALRYLVAPPERRGHALAGILDAVNPSVTALWDPLEIAAGRMTADLGEVRFLDAGGPAALAVALDLPDAAALAALRAAAADVVVILSAYQIPYLQKLAHPLRPLRVAGPSDEARTRMSDIRRRLRERLAGADLTPSLLALEPLFDEYDPALVAAAALGMDSPTPAADATPALPAFVRIRVDSGRRDQLRVGDLVGVLLNAVGLTREDLGRVEVRDGFSLIEVRATAAERAVAGLSGTMVRGRRIAARLERR